MSDLSVVGGSLPRIGGSSGESRGLIHVEHEEIPAALSRRDD